jgi:hypothetical protein
MKHSFFPSAFSAPFLYIFSFFVPVVCCAAQSDVTIPEQAATQSSEGITVAIPGPLRPFLRMAAISQQISPDEVLPLLARNVFLRGYEGSHHIHQTEFLVLLIRYVRQSRELAALAGTQGVLRVSNCIEAQPLLKVLGYQPRPDCGQLNAPLLTNDPARAFITVDSGFPLLELEASLQQGKPFNYTFASSYVPALLAQKDWRDKEITNESNLIDAILQDRAFARFYWAMSRIDRETRVALQQPQSIKKMLPLGADLDFYGAQIHIRSGRVIVPGGRAAEAGWKDLVGASPGSPAEFVTQLLAKDGGWMAAYFDALCRVSRVQQTHFTDPRYIRRYYGALRGTNISPDAVTGVFRPNSALLLLVTRAWFEPNREPHVPGDLNAWKQLLGQKTDWEVRKIGKHVQLDTPEQLLETMFALSRTPTTEGPLQAYLLLSELDARRAPDHRVSPETALLMASNFAELNDQYRIFPEFPELDDASITSFLTTAARLSKISDTNLRANAVGTFEASLGLWQILARQEQIPVAELNASWQRLLKPFGDTNSSADVFDAGINSIRVLRLAVTGNPHGSQDEFISLLAGPRELNPDGQQIHNLLATRMRTILDEQRLVSLDVLLPLGDALHDVDRVKAEANTLLPLAGELREFDMPQPIFHASERDVWAPGIYNNHHTDLQMKTNLTAVIKSPSSVAQLTAARGQLAPFLRDTLVGLNYAYYEPPGAQMLHHNPLFVRSHDFAPETVLGRPQRMWQAPQLFGAGSPAGGGAHLVGSLADLPYVLARAEQDFIAPENVQALIWDDVVPGLLTSAVVPRWWRATQNELHAVALYQQSGEELLAASVHNENLRKQVMSILDERMASQTSERLERALSADRLAEILPQLLSADTFWLAAEYRRRFPDQTDAFGPAGRELESLYQHYPDEVNFQRLSRDFGVPHPILEQSYHGDLMNLAPFPAFAGSASRLLAESWDSNNLYWVRLADEKGYSPVMLNRLVPELTLRMVEKIFATDIEDWPALWRATRETGDEFRSGKIASLFRGDDNSQQ